MHICVESVWMHRKSICSGTQFHHFCSIATIGHSVTVTFKFYRVYRGKQSLKFLFSDKFSTFRWKLQYYRFASSCTLLQNEGFIRILWTFYYVICRVYQQIIVRRGVWGRAGVVLTHKREQHSNCEGGCQEKFSIEFVTWSKHKSLGFYQAQISKNP